MSRQKDNSHEDIRTYHQLMGDICLKRARNPNANFFMDIKDRERRIGFIRHTLPDAMRYLEDYGNDPELAVAGYYIHEAIAHFEAINDMDGYRRANKIRSDRNIAYDQDSITRHKREHEQITPSLAGRLVIEFEYLSSLHSRLI